MWCYKERHQGKEHIEGIGRSLRNCVYRSAIYGKCVIETSMQFAQHDDKAVKDMTSLYLSAEDVLIEPDNIKVSPRIKDTLQIHIIKQFFDEQNAPYLQFCKNGKRRKTFLHTIL